MRAPRSTSSPRASASARRLHRSATARRELFYPLSSRALRSFAPAAAGEGGRASARARATRAARRPTSRTCSGWPHRSSTRDCYGRARRSSSRRTTCCRGARRRSTTSGAAVRPLRADRRAQRARPRGAGRTRRRRDEAARDPASRHAERPAADGRRPDGARARRDPALQAGRPCGRGGRPRRRRTAPRGRRPGWPAAREPEGADLRLGYLPHAELQRALGDATVAVFPYRAELDQSGALLQALGAGIPAVVYDVGGLPDPVRHVRRGPRRARRTTSTASQPRSASCSTTRRARGRPGQARGGPARR